MSTLLNAKPMEGAKSLLNKSQNLENDYRTCLKIAQNKLIEMEGVFLKLQKFSLVSKGRGRPKGSLNKTTLVKVESTPTRGRGRPKGSLNKTTMMKVKSAPTKGRGRPKGSLNKTTLVKNESTATKGRGRPKGSLNKTTLMKNEPTPTKGRGRPKGFKNNEILKVKENVFKLLSLNSNNGGLSVSEIKHILSNNGSLGMVTKIASSIESLLKEKKINRNSANRYEISA